MPEVVEEMAGQAEDCKLWGVFQHLKRPASSHKSTGNVIRCRCAGAGAGAIHWVAMMIFHPAYTVIDFQQTTVTSIHEATSATANTWTGGLRLPCMSLRRVDPPSLNPALPQTASGGLMGSDAHSLARFFGALKSWGLVVLQCEASGWRWLPSSFWEQHFYWAGQPGKWAGRPFPA